MFITETQIRIHYALTDQMGIVYHGHYAQFFEIGRTEAFRDLGLTYKDVEDMGIIMPVVSLKTNFLRPIKYDDLITVKSTLRELPVDHKITIYAEIFNEADELLSTGEVTLYFLERTTMKKTTMPSSMHSILAGYF